MPSGYDRQSGVTRLRAVRLKASRRRRGKKQLDAAPAGDPGAKAGLRQLFRDNLCDLLGGKPISFLVEMDEVEE